MSTHLYQQGSLRRFEEPAALIPWSAASVPPDPHGRVADTGDPAVRDRVATDLGLPQF